MTQTRHPLLPAESHDERARGTFVSALKRHVATRVSPGVRDVYDHRAAARWADEHDGAPPADRFEVREALAPDTYYRLWSAVRRSSQHLLWNSVGDTVGRQAADLARRASGVEPSGGSLTLDPDMALPWYQYDVDIHAMPGGYRGEYRDDDVWVGAVYDRGVYLYAMGQMGDLNDDYGHTIIDNHLRVEHPGWTPRRILDMGCTVGHATLPYAAAFPDAEVHAIDVGAPVLRYGHARAEAMGIPVHFSQQNCEQTAFPDGHFDLIVSHILLHELPPDAIRRTFAECHRLLAPGGVMVHGDFAGYAGVDALTQAMIDWDTYNNHEPFWGPMRSMDLVAEAVDAGFDPDEVEAVVVPTGRVLQSGKGQSTGQLSLLTARRLAPEVGSSPAAAAEAHATG